MKSKTIIVGIAGFLLFLSIIATFAFLFQKNSSDSNELNFDEAISKIKNKEISEIVIKQDKVELIGKNKEKFFSDSMKATRYAKNCFQPLTMLILKNRARSK